MNIESNGSWTCSDNSPHSFDGALCRQMINMMQCAGVKSVADLGCGSGEYVGALIGNGFEAVGYDGNPNTNKFHPSCHVMDISKFSVNIPVVDCVVSLEVGEHIPREFEEDFLNNVSAHASRMVIMSWFPIPGHGIGHVNERSNEWVKEQMRQRGLYSNDHFEKTGRDASIFWWFKHSFMVFERK